MANSIFSTSWLSSVPLSSDSSSRSAKKSKISTISTDLDAFISSGIVSNIIFSFARKDLSEYALVSKNWKLMTYDPLLQKNILSSQYSIFGAQEWAIHFNAKGQFAEPRLPLDFYKSSDWKLTLAPEIFETEEKEKIDTSDINCLDAISQKKKICSIGYSPYINAKENINKKTHWIAYKLRQLKPFIPKVTRCTPICLAHDATIACLMEKIKSGTNFIFTEEKDLTIVSLKEEGDLEIMSEDLKLIEHNNRSALTRRTITVRIIF